MHEPMTAARLDALVAAFEAAHAPERAYLRVCGEDYFDLIEALRIARRALAEIVDDAECCPDKAPDSAWGALEQIEGRS